jgi:outer membrane immunogenic protein
MRRMRSRLSTHAFGRDHVAARTGQCEVQGENMAMSIPMALAGAAGLAIIRRAKREGARVSGILGIALCAVGAVPAVAADLSLQAPPPVPVYNWTGFYAGAHVGGGWDRAMWTEDGSASSPAFGVVPPGFLDGTVNASGVLGGGQGGFNYQLGSTVFGVEADVSGAHITGSTTCFTALAGTGCSSRINAVGTVSARVGTTYNNLLLYILGGGAWWNERFQTSGGVPGPAAFSTVPLGWTLGVGLEYAISPQWSAFLQFNYIDFFDPRDLTFTGTPPPGFTENIRENLSVLKIGFNYRFGALPGLAR